MDPPPLSQPPPAPPLSAAVPPAPTTVPASNYSESLESSPRSRNADSYFDDPPHLASKLRLMCSYGGHIVPRPHDKSLCYVGGDTRIVVVDRRSSLASLSSRLANTLLNGRPFTLKYQLPSEDLDSLISVTTDEDLENMIEEYDRTSSNSAKPLRLRLFLFPLKPDSSQSIGVILEGSAKTEDWFLNALNGATGMLNRGFSDPASVNCLLGLGDDSNSILNSNSNGDLVGSGAGGVGVRDVELSNKNGNAKQQNSGGGGQDVHSVPDSPMLETTSSFGSTSSSTMANLPPIRVHVEDQKSVGIEEQFAQISVSSGVTGGGVHKFDEGGFAALSSPPPMPVSFMPGLPVMVGDYQNNNRVYSDDERSDHGATVGYNRKLPPQTQLPPQPQQKTNGGGNGGAVDLASPDSVSSDNSLSSAINRQKHMLYQDPVMQFPPGAIRVPAGANPVDPKLNGSDPNGQIQMQESAYVMQPQPQFDQQQQQQQYIHAGAQYIQHHPAAGSVPMPAYYHPVYTQQQPSHQHQLHHQLDQQYPVYYVQARPPQTYKLPLQQQSNMTEPSTNIPSSRPQTPPNPSMVPSSAAYNPMRNVPMSKPEMAAAPGMYRTTATTGAPQLVQVPSGQQQQQHQQQYVAYSQMHPSQSITPPAGNPGYAYEYVDPPHSQMFYTQPLAPTMTSQYQTMAPTATVGLPEPSAQIPTDTNKQQIRTS